MLVIVLGRLAQFILMLVTLKISTYLLSPAEMGKMALLTSSIAFISMFLVNPVGMYVNRHLHDWNTHGLVRRYLNYHWFYLFIVALFASIIFGLINYIGLSISYFSTSFLVFFIFCTLFFNTINQTSIPSLNMLGFRLSFTMLSIATVFFGIIFAVILVYYFGSKSEYWLLGLLAAQIIFALIGSKFFYSKINSEFIGIKSQASIADIKKVFCFSWPIAVAVGLTWFQSQSYRFFIGHSFGLDSLGLFVAGYGISAGIIAAFEAIFTTYFQPLFYKKISQPLDAGEIVAWNEYAAAIIPTLVFLFFVITTFAPILTEVMLSNGYQGAARFVVWGAFIEIFRVLANVFSMAAHAKKDTKMLIIPNLIGAVVSILLICMLTPILGILGIGLALALAGLSVTFFLHRRVQSKYVILIPYGDVAHAICFGLILWLLNAYVHTLLLPSHLMTLMIQSILLLFIIIPSELFLLSKVMVHYKKAP